MIKRFLKDENGQGMVEYALILALIAVAVITVVGLIGTAIEGKFNYIEKELSKGPTAGGTTSTTTPTAP